MKNNKPKTSRGAVLKQLGRRLKELEPWERKEAQGLKMIAESYGFKLFIKEINEKFML
jgi:hypothetical protein